MIQQEQVMSKQVLYVGIDVGCEELWGSVPGMKAKRFEHSKRGIRSLYTWAAKRAGDDQMHFCMEATGVYSISAASQMVSEYQARVSVVNPAQIAAYGRVQMKRSKTDQIDAHVIRNYAETQSPPLWTPAVLPLRQLTSLVTQADAIKDSLGQWRNRRHAQKFVPDLPEEVKKTQRSIERSLTTQLKNMETAIANLCAQEATLAQKVVLLCTIPGVANKSAVKLLAYGQDWLTERSAKALTAYAGLAPHHHQSGSSVRGKSRIDKRGNPKLRKTLYMPALVAVHHNPVLTKFYKRLLNNGKPKKLALAAAMRKLLIISRAMLIAKKPFNPQIQH
jgi:transposase